jgi:uncharacterized membrane protein YoaT (DUF817 family)
VVIAIFHLVGTVMEVFKTAHGSWIYPEPSLLRIGGVPLFSGFMYACIGSYLARACGCSSCASSTTRRSGRPGCWRCWPI